MVLVESTSDAFRRLFVRLDPGEELMTGLASALAAQHPPVQAGSISGIGSVRRAVLGYYDLERKQYLRQEFPEVMELCCLIGNVTLLDGQPFVHAHAVLSGPDYLPRSGHLFHAEIAATGEFWILEGGLRLERSHDPVTGLKLVK